MVAAHRADHVYPGPAAVRIIGAKVAAGVLLAWPPPLSASRSARWSWSPRITGRPDVAGRGPRDRLRVRLPILNLLLGVGFGLLFRNTPVAVVMYFVLPTAWSILTGAVSALAATGRWLDPSTAWNHLRRRDGDRRHLGSGRDRGRVWIIAPVLAGGWRVLNRPVDA